MPATVPSVVDEMSLRMASEICYVWRSFREAPNAAQIKARIQVAIASAIVKELQYTTKIEMGIDKETK